MRDLVKNVRFYVLVGSVVLSVLVYFVSGDVYELTEHYGQLAFAFLYLAMAIGPVSFTFNALPFRGQIVKSRRAVGVSAFYFGLLHGVIAFWGELGGFAGVKYFDQAYWVALSLSATALAILTALAATSFDSVIEKMTFAKWKKLHQQVYVAGMAILGHVLILGSDIKEVSGLKSKIVYAAVGLLFVLEATRIEAKLQKRFLKWPKFAVVPTLVAVGIGYFAGKIW